MIVIDRGRSDDGWQVTEERRRSEEPKIRRDDGTTGRRDDGTKNAKIRTDVRGRDVARDNHRSPAVRSHRVIPHRTTGPDWWQRLWQRQHPDPPDGDRGSEEPKLREPA